MVFKLNDNYFSILSITVKNCKSEANSIEKIKNITKDLYGVMSPHTPLKIGRKTWTNNQIWKFYSKREIDNSYSGLAKTILIDKKVPRSKDFEKYIAKDLVGQLTIQTEMILSEDALEEAARELM